MEQYRARWNLSRAHEITAPGYSERRSGLAKQIGLGTATAISAAGKAGIGFELVVAHGKALHACARAADARRCLAEFERDLVRVSYRRGRTR